MIKKRPLFILFLTLLFVNLTIGQSFAYVISPDFYRPSSTCSWYLDSSVYNNLGGSATTAVTTSASTWNNAESDFCFVKSSGVVDNKVKYGTTLFYALGETKHYTYFYDWDKIKYTITTLSNDYTWNTGGFMDMANYEADVRTIATHEFGHWLVLDHDSRYTSAVMWPQDLAKWSLHQDDVNGINAIW